MKTSVEKFFEWANTVTVNYDTDTYLTEEETDHRGHGVCVFEMFQERIAHNDSWGWIFYDGNHWVRDGAHSVAYKMVENTLCQRRYAAQYKLSKDWARAKAGDITIADFQEKEKQTDRFIAQCAVNSGRVRGIMESIQANCYRGVDQFDVDPDMLNCANGVLDLKTGRMVDHDPSQSFTYCIPTEYDPTVDYSEWESWLLGTVDNDQQMLDAIRVITGYFLTGHTIEDAFFYIYGPTRSGKGTYTEALMHTLGEPLCQSTEFGTFTNDSNVDSQNFALAPLSGSRLIVASESQTYERFNEAKIKRITGGDKIRASYKHKDSFEYQPRYKILLSSNHPVNADPDDAAVWYRLIMIVFPISQKGKEDPTIKQRMRDHDMRKQILSWAAQGAQQWYAGSRIRTMLPDSSIEEISRQRGEVDEVSAWIEECCEGSDPLDATQKSTNSEIYQSYKSWCDDNGIKPKGKRSLGKSLAGKGYEPTHITINQVGANFTTSQRRKRGRSGLTVKH